MEDRSPSKRGYYRRYNSDKSRVIPRSTLWRMKKQKIMKEEHSDSSHITQPDNNINDSYSEESDVEEIQESNQMLYSSEDSMDSEESDVEEIQEMLDSSEDSIDDDDNDEIDTNRKDTDDISDDDNEHDEDNYNTNIFDPLYDGANITICGAYCAIMHFKSICKLPFSTIDQLLQLLHLLCPNGNKLPKSIYFLRKFFTSLGTKQVRKQYCSNCNEESEMCECGFVNEPNTYIEMDIISQFKTILTRHWNALQQAQTNESLISVKTMLCQDLEFFKHKEHLGVIINTDGVSLFKSSKSSVWPVYLEIANLPVHLRFRHDNTVICGLYVGERKPSMELLLKPVMRSIDHLHCIGFPFKCPEGTTTVRVKLLFGVFDLIAKAQVLNMKQFNGAYGCSVCLHPGKTGTTCVRTYPPGTTYPMRTVADIDNAIEEGKRCGNIVRGIKGISPFSGYMDLVKAIPVDYMHCVNEGVVKSLLVAWTSSKNHKQPYSVRKYLNKIDQSLRIQHPPHDFTRPPRSIVSHLSYWKASEFRNWLLYYSLPLLKHFLPPLYLHHFSLLVCAMHILLQTDLSNAQCNAAEEMLQDFYKLLPELYGDLSCTMNAHSLIHIPYFVRHWGPLWSMSAFSFESHNGHLTKMIHSTRKVAEQVSFSIDVKQTLQKIYVKLEGKDSKDVLSFLGYTNQIYLHSNMTKLSNGYAIGVIKACDLNTEQYNLLLEISPEVPRQAQVFERFWYNHMLIHSSTYRSGEGKRSSCYCAYIDCNGREMYGKIELFAECPPLGTVAFVKPLILTHSHILKSFGNSSRPILEHHANLGLISKFIIEVLFSSTDSTLTCMLVSSIVSSCILIEPLESPSCSYIIKVPNNYEHH